MFRCSISTLLAHVIVSVLCMPWMYAQTPDSVDYYLELQETELAKVCWLNIWANKYADDYPEEAVRYSLQALQLSEELGNDSLIAESGYSLGKAYYWKKGDMPKAEKPIYNGYELFLRNGDKKNAARGLRKLCVLMGKLGNMGKAREYGLEAAQTCREIQDWDGEGRAYVTLGYRYLRNANSPDSALHFFREALMPYRKAGKEARALINIGDVQHTLGQFFQAKSTYQQAVVAAEKEEDEQLQARAANNLGRVFMENGQYEQALHWFQQALDLNRKLNRIRQQAIQLNNISDLLQSMGHEKQALNILYENIQLRRQIGDVRGESHSLFNISTVHIKMGQLDSALFYAQQSLALRKAMKGRAYETAVSLQVIGDVFMKKEAYDKALEYYLEGYGYTQKDGYQVIQQNLNNRIVSILLVQKRHLEAVARLQKNLQATKGSGNLIGRRDALKLMATLQERLGNYPQALQFEREYKLYYDSVFSQESQKNMAELEVKYSLVEEERKNEVLRRQNLIQEASLTRTRLTAYLLGGGISLTLLIIALIWYNLYRKKKYAQDLEHKQRQILAQKSRLSELNSTKDRLFAILSHDLKSPLSSLNSLLQLLNYGVVDQKTFLSRVEALEKDTEGVVALLEQLLLWARVQLQGVYCSPQNLKLCQWLQEWKARAIFSQELNASDRVQVQCDQGLYTQTDPDILEIILRNLVINALKFSPEHELVYVQVKPTGKKLQLKIIDNGNGLSQEKLQDIFSLKTSAETDYFGKHSTGLGLAICSDLADLLGANLKVENRKEGGACFWLELPWVQGHCQETAQKPAPKTRYKI